MSLQGLKPVSVSAALLRIVLVDWLLQGPGLKILGCLYAYDIQRLRLSPLTWQV